MKSLTKYNFKVGDKVRVLNTEHVRSWDKNRGVIGYIFTIKGMGENALASFNEGHAWCIDHDNKYGINYLPSDLEKVPEVYHLSGQSLINFGQLHLAPKFLLVLFTGTRKFNSSIFLCFFYYFIQCRY